MTIKVIGLKMFHYGPVGTVDEGREIPAERLARVPQSTLEGWEKQGLVKVEKVAARKAPAAKKTAAKK